MMQFTEEQRKALAAEIVEQLVDCGSADDVAVERYVEWVFKRLSTIAPPVVSLRLPDEKFCPAEYEGSLLWSETEMWNKCLNEVKRLNATAPAVPDGWKLVPVIALPSQWAAGRKAFDSAGMNKVDAVYKAMVTVAPEGGAIRDDTGLVDLHLYELTKNVAMV